MDMDDYIAAALKAANAAKDKEQKKSEKSEKSERKVQIDSAAVKRAAAAEKGRTLLEAARAREMKQGSDLVEEFLRDISPIILTFMAREDAHRLRDSGHKLIINFSKVDGANAPSYTVIGGSGKGKNDRLIPSASIAKWAENDAMYLAKYHSEGGPPTVSSRHEMLTELRRVNKENARLRLLLERAGERALEESKPMPAGNTPVSDVPTNIQADVPSSIPAPAATSEVAAS